MPFAAFDLHKKNIQAAVLADDGSLVLQQRFPTERQALVQFAREHLSPQHILVVEATFNTWPIVETVTPFVKEVIVSNPLRTRAIAAAKIKTDKVDALVLATLARLDFLPRVWIPDSATSLARRATTERAMLTSDRTRIKNRIHAILHHRLLTPPVKDLFGPSGLDWLATVPLDPPGRQALDRQLRLLAQIETEIEDVNTNLCTAAWTNPKIKLLMTLPGVDYAVATSLLAALGDHTRFRGGDKAASYLGLVPSTRQSGEHCYHGPITKQGRSHARWMMVQAAQQLDTHPGPLGVFFRRIAKHKNRNVAVVATAHKLVVIAWHMLTNNEPYRYSVPSTTQAKLDRLRIRATGKKKKGGVPGKTPRPATYGTGNQTRAVPSLDQVYKRYEFPDAPAPKAGEKAMIERQGLAGFEASLHQPRRVPRKAPNSPKPNGETAR